MASDEKIQEAILGIVIEEFRDKNSIVSIGGGGIIDGVRDSLDGVDESDVQYHLERLDDDFCIDYTRTTGQGMIELEARGIDKYEQLSDEIVIPQRHVDEVIGALYQTERDNPDRPRASREDLLQSTELDEDELDRTVWYLKEKRLVDAQTKIGQPWWSGAKITERGRSLHEQ